MAFTREERRAVEETIKRVRKLEVEVQELSRLNAQLLDMLDRIESETNMADWTSDQWRRFLEPYITNKSGTSRTVQHDHLTPQQGGPCFAELGATLIE